jgi:hypothetical protein
MRLEFPPGPDRRERNFWMRRPGKVVGLKLVTHHPVIKLGSAARRERNFSTQRQARKSRLNTE